MFSYKVGDDAILMVIEEDRVLPIFRFPAWVTAEAADSVAAALTELSDCLVRSRGTFHRRPTRVRLVRRWAERRRECLDIIEKGAPGHSPNDPRYRSTREAARTVTSAIRGIGVPELVEAVIAVVTVEIEAIEAQEEAGVFGRLGTPNAPLG